ncbi:unnamed protein product [Cochlearia groenlandica]
MTGFDDNKWLDSSSNHKKRSKPELDREVSLQDTKSYKDSMQTTFQEKPGYTRGGLGERIAARARFNVPRLDTETIHRSPCLTISSPGLSPVTLIESPVFLSNPLLSPTTGKLSSLHCEKPKEEFFEDTTTPLAFDSIPRQSLDYRNTDLEPNDGQTQLGGLGDSMPSGAPADDGYHWRKYGQKLVKGSVYPRSYYKCTHPNCEVKKKVERSREGDITQIIYSKSHNHPKSQPNRRSSIGSSGTRLDLQIHGTGHEGFVATSENIEWASPVSAENEYRSYYGSMQVQSGTRFGYGDGDSFFIDEDDEDRVSHTSVSLGYDREVDEYESKRRKLEEAYAAETSGSTRASRERKVVVQATSDIDILDDGFRWRKYGQKVVKGNPNPRSYYKCTAIGCAVTKHVERASDDLNSVLTTYIGQHNHEVPSARNSSHASPATIQGGLATQTHNHHLHYQLPHNISEEELVTANPSLFDFQQNLWPPSGFSDHIGQNEFSGVSIPCLAIKQEKLPDFPASTIGDPAGLMSYLEAEPKVEPGSEQDLGLSSSSLIYKDVMSRLSQI